MAFLWENYSDTIWEIIQTRYYDTSINIRYAYIYYDGIMDVVSQYGTPFQKYFYISRLYEVLHNWEKQYTEGKSFRIPRDFPARYTRGQAIIDFETTCKK